MQLVPFDLQRHQLRNDVVDVGRTGDVDGERFLTVEVVAAPPSRRALHLPALHVDVEHSLEDLGRLTEHDALHGDDGRWQSPQRIDQRAGVRFGRPGLGVQAGAHPDVGLLEHLELGLTGTSEQRAVGPGVELDRVPARSAITLEIVVRHCGYYPAAFRKPAGDVGSPIYIF